MSEKLYALLLRLHCSHFRETFGDEALQLFRDRARDETGFFPRLRLWFDLLADLAVSVPRGYRHTADLAVASIRQPADGIPSFRVLAREPPARGAILFGGVLSLITLAAVPALIDNSGNYGRFLPADLYRRSAPQPRQRATSRAMTPANSRLDAAEKKRVIRAVIVNLKQHYVDAAAAQKIADALLAHERQGDYAALNDAPAFAELLTRQLTDISRDPHIDVVYSERPLQARPAVPAAESLARYRAAMEQENCTFERVEVLEHNIGYLKLNSFPDPAVCQTQAAAALASVNHADAIIFDLRDNRGGYPNMVALIAGYLFDHPEYLYNPRENTTERSWTQSPVAGSRLSDKPVYVLTSSRTASGAEQFSYDLKMLKRATLVGEATRGATHSGVFHRIDEHFGMGIPEAKPVNPFSKADWEGTGVEPDVRVKETDALERAKSLAASRHQSGTIE